MTNHAELQKALPLRSLFALAFGCIIGVGWVTVLGVWLTQAGSLGALLGFVGGGLLMLLIGVCYAEVAAMYPVSGGEVAYVYEMYGSGMAFAAGWALTFVYVITTAFEVISVGWVLSALFPGTEGPVLYTILGQDVHLYSLLSGVAIMAFLGWINFRGAKSSARFQNVLTATLLVSSSVFIVAGLFSGDVSNLDPLVIPRGGDWGITGILAVLATTPFWFSGFDAIPQAMGELQEDAPLSLLPKVIALAIGSALVFYLLIILTASISMPRSDLLAANLPVAAAIEHALGSRLFGKIVLFAGLCGLLSTWNATYFAATRLFYALGRAQMIPTIFGRVHPRFAAPGVSIVFVGVLASVIGLLGRSAVGLIANAAATNMSFVFVIVCLGIARLRRTAPNHPRPFKMPGGTPVLYMAALASFVTLLLSLHGQATSGQQGIPVEWWLMAGWIALGLGFWFATARIRGELTEAERRQMIIGED